MPRPWVYITSTPVPVPVFRRHNKLLYVKWAREGLPWSGVPRFSKMAGILVSKLGAETHALAAGKNTRTPRPDRGAAKQALHSPGRGQQGKLPTARPRAGTQWTPPLLKPVGQWPPLFDKAAGAVGLYHVHPCSSSCFPAPQQAFVGEMGQKGVSVVASSTFFEKGRNFSKQVGR